MRKKYKSFTTIVFISGPYLFIYQTALIDPLSPTSVRINFSLFCRMTGSVGLFPTTPGADNEHVSALKITHSYILTSTLLLPRLARYFPEFRARDAVIFHGIAQRWPIGLLCDGKAMGTEL